MHSIGHYKINYFYYNPLLSSSSSFHLLILTFIILPIYPSVNPSRYSSALPSIHLSIYLLLHSRLYPLFSPTFLLKREEKGRERDKLVGNEVGKRDKTSHAAVLTKGAIIFISFCVVFIAIYQKFLFLASSFPQLSRWHCYLSFLPP